MASYARWVVCRERGCEVPNKWNEHISQSANINENTILWDSIITDRKISANRPDVAIHDRKSMSRVLIDVSVPDDKNIALKEADKISKYKDLEIEINRMWNVKTKVVLVVVGTLRKYFAKGVELTPGPPKIQRFKKYPCWELPSFYGMCLDESLRVLVVDSGFILRRLEGREE